MESIALGCLITGRIVMGRYEQCFSETYTNVKVLDAIAGLTLCYFYSVWLEKKFKICHFVFLTFFKLSTTVTESSNPYHPTQFYHTA